MARRKSAETCLIESVLSKQGGNLSWGKFILTDEYRQALTDCTIEPIGSMAFAAVKSRFNRSGGVAVEEEVAPVAPVVRKTLQKVGGFGWEVVDHNYSSEISEMIPEIDENFVVPDANKDVVSLVQEHSKVSNCNVRLVGPAGCGKTSFATNYAARRRCPVLVMDCANVREPRDWFGYRTFDPSSKEIVWHESMFVKMVETPHAVIVLDELNRVSPMVTNTLIPLLDHRAKTYLEEAGRTIKLAEGVTFWAAVNEGNQFTGTVSMDAAMKNRFSYVVECNFLDATTETSVLHKKTGLDLANCTRLVEVANQVRLKAMSEATDSFSEPISTRMLEAAARGMVMGGAKTLRYTVLNHFSGDGGQQSERENLRKLLVGKFGSI